MSFIGQYLNFLKPEKRVPRTNLNKETSIELLDMVGTRKEVSMQDMFL